MNGPRHMTCPESLDSSLVRRIIAPDLGLQLLMVSNKEKTGQTGGWLRLTKRYSVTGEFISTILRNICQIRVPKKSTAPLMMYLVFLHFPARNWSRDLRES